jgi:hypothetical protein
MAVVILLLFLCSCFSQPSFEKPVLALKSHAGKKNNVAERLRVELA